MSRKPRADARLKTLPEEGQARLNEFLRDGSYADGVTFCAEEFGVETSAAALSEFYSWYGLRARFRRAKSRSRQVMDELRNRDPEVDADALADAGNQVFMMEAMESGNPKFWAMVMRQFVSLKKARTDVEKLEMQIREYEEKREKAKAEVEAALTENVSGGLSEETLRKIEGAMKLL
jgi:hypothetical protein